MSSKPSENQLAGLKAHAQKVNRNSVERIQKALKCMQLAGKAINFETVAKEADVARGTLYNNPEIKAEIMRLRQADFATQRIAARQTRKRTEPDRIEMLRVENQKLRVEKEKLILQLIQIEELREENETLKKRLGEMQGK